LGLLLLLLLLLLRRRRRQLGMLLSRCIKLLVGPKL
jgi:hypothetical protein